MTRFVVGDDRGQSTLFPERLDDYLGEDNPVRAVDVFVDELDLAGLGFGGAEPEATGRPAYHPATLLKIYVYGYLNRVQSSRRLERSGPTAPASGSIELGYRARDRSRRPRRLLPLTGGQARPQVREWLPLRPASRSCYTRGVLLRVMQCLQSFLRPWSEGEYPPAPANI
jgi:hypothetical protein